jgi:hypothetical protein
VKKGFFFTISIIFFSTTLVFFAQSFSNNTLTRDALLLHSIVPLTQSFVNNDFANDILEISGSTIDINYSSSQIEFNISGIITNDFNISQELQNYEDFLENTFFDRISGTQSINLSNLYDGDIEIVSEKFDIIFNYDSNEFVLNSENDMTSLDINLDFEGVIDSNFYSFSSGGVPLNLFFTGDSNILSFSTLIDTNDNSDFYFTEGDNIISININDDNIIIDSNSSQNLEYEIKANYSYEEEAFNLDINSFFEYASKNTYSNSLIKII